MEIFTSFGGWGSLERMGARLKDNSKLESLSQGESYSVSPCTGCRRYLHTHVLHTHSDSTPTTHSHIDHCSGQDLPSFITLQTLPRQVFPLSRPRHSLYQLFSPALPPKGPPYTSLRSSQHPGSPPFSQGLLTLLWDPHYLKVPSSFSHHYLMPSGHHSQGSSPQGVRII